MKAHIIAAALALAGCSSLTATPPAQPTPESAQLINVRIATISSDPVSTWQNNDYAVRAACYDYLNQQAQRSSDIGLASGALGMAGGAAALASAHPAVGAGLALASAFLNMYQQSGVIPYTTETTTLIEAALDSVEAVVALTPPKTTAQALLDIQKLWWQCSAGGYKMLVSQSVMMGAHSIRAMPSITGVPRISVEPPDPLMSSQMNVISVPKAEPKETSYSEPETAPVTEPKETRSYHVREHRQVPVQPSLEDLAWHWASGWDGRPIRR